MNKELVEKIEKEIGTYSNDLTKNIATRIARIASEHYGDKWISVDVIKPEYFVDVQGRLANLVEVICYYDDITECFMDVDGNIYDITHWKPQQ